MKRFYLGLILFLAVTAIVLGLLRMVNWLPLAFQTDTPRRYGSIEQVKEALRIKDLYVPAYFPQTIKWPPSAIVAQGRPSVGILMIFNKRGSNEELLVITQTVSDAFARASPLKMTAVAESAPYRLRGRTAVLEVGACGRDEKCSRISWQEGSYHMTLTMKSPPFELIRIAGSMLH